MQSGVVIKSYRYYPYLIKKDVSLMSSPYDNQYRVSTDDIYKAMSNSNFQKKQIQQFSDFNMMKPLSFGFSRLFNNLLFWMLGTVVLSIIATIGYAISAVPAAIPLLASDAISSLQLGMIPDIDIASIIGFVITFFLIIIIVSFFQGTFIKNSLKETRVTKKNSNFIFKDFFNNINWKNTVLSVIASWLFLFLYCIIFGLFMILSLSLPTIVSIIVGIGMVLLSVPIGVLFTFVPYYAIDNKSTILGSFRLAWKDIMGNFFPILGASILTGIVMAGISMITFGIGFIIAFPVQYLAYTHIYKQISEGIVISE